MSGLISDDPEGFAARFLRDRAEDIEEGLYTVESIAQTFGAGPEDDDLYRIQVTLRRTRQNQEEVPGPPVPPEVPGWEPKS